MKIFTEGNYIVVTDDSDNELYDSPIGMTQFSISPDRLNVIVYQDDTRFEKRNAITLEVSSTTDAAGGALTGGLITWLRNNTGF